MASESTYVKTIAAVLRKARHIPRREERPFVGAGMTTKESDRFSTRVACPRARLPMY